MIHLPHTLAGLADICADQSARYSMAGVHVTDHGHAYELVATDGKRLLLVQGINEPNPLLNEVVEAADDSETSAVIAADDWANALKWKWAWQSTVVPLSIALGKNGQITMAKGEQSLRTQAVEGRYPDYHAILPKSPSRISFKVGVDLLLGLLKAFKTAGAEDVEILWYGNGKPFGLAAETESGIVLDALQMPLT
jgi:DNA polymerase III sliding clamp (beta) subunit (PCNA family)